MSLMSDFFVMGSSDSMHNQLPKEPEDSIPSNAGSSLPCSMKATFWTQCPSCKMQLEYYQIYADSNLCCAVCLKPFVAYKISSVDGTLLWFSKVQEGSKLESHTNPCMRLNCSSQADNLWSPDFESPTLCQFEKSKNMHKDVAKLKGLRSEESKLWKGKKKREGKGSKAKVCINSKEHVDRLVALAQHLIRQKLLELKKRKATMGIVVKLAKERPARVQQTSNGAICVNGRAWSKGSTRCGIRNLGSCLKNLPFLNQKIPRGRRSGSLIRCARQEYASLVRKLKVK